MIINPEYLYEVFVHAEKADGSAMNYNNVIYVENNDIMVFNQYTLREFLTLQQNEITVLDICFYRATVVSLTMTIDHKMKLVRKWTPQNGWRNEIS